ncbi:hypothetical protein DPMN_178921 [Dreissena polymorpha]|uniref:Uncharacterized protein n=1 Tax=Dreissena polymorpha TaxID=45954 RepID=A0A9D4EBH0_DREPO|nr:hypothetical protein DPMN_178921 [Dreissena polymorpha]
MISESDRFTSPSVYKADRNAVVPKMESGAHSMKTATHLVATEKAEALHRVLNEKYNSAEVSWLPGFHGGYSQTSTDAIHWKNVSLIDGGTYSNEVAINETLSGLEPETLY